MYSSPVRRTLTLVALTLVYANLALAEDIPSKPATPPVASSMDSPHNDHPTFTDWKSLAEINPSGKLVVVTIAEPTRRQTCRVQSFAPDQLVCKRSFGATHTYKSQDIASVIVPGDFGLKIGLVLGFNATLGASIWGTVVLAAICPGCAVATGIAALLIFGAAGAILIADDASDSLLYLAPGQALQVKLRY